MARKRFSIPKGFNPNLQTYADIRKLPTNLVWFQVPVEFYRDEVSARSIVQVFYSEAQCQLLDILTWHPGVARFHAGLAIPAKHTPSRVKVGQPLVTHFVVFMKDGRRFALNVRAVDPQPNESALEKAMQEFWQAQGIPWRLVHPSEIHEGLGNFCRLIRRHEDMTHFNPEVKNRVQEIRARLEETILLFGGSLPQVCSHVAQAMGLKPATCLTVAYHLFCTHQWAPQVLQSTECLIPDARTIDFTGRSPKLPTDLIAELR